MRYTYPALVIEDELGGYCTYLNDFNQVTEGRDVAEAVEMGADALWLIIDDYLQLDKPLPQPTYPEEHEGLLVAISVDVSTERGLLTTRMAAIELGVSDARVRQMVCSGQLASKKIGRDSYVYLWSIRERQANPPKPGRPKKKALAEQL
ncbi:type II toxin-antitoxin system HicB family antitoxin [Arabiibacter massiliensis]|uniref:type II toxin-antitoxin system HicB family antitoxin n=1 Tax=Arabiibacter massiliensis TaxID=1870985 RepID=UPI0009B9A168|nr:type II toxin-antitoxin system HicB family antitoxin [Arabiibacter massiliensis]